MTHCPPRHFLDRNYLKIHCGCDDLYEQVIQRIKPRVHIFGHIHEGYGYDYYDNITFVNACTCTDQYVPENVPVVFEV